MKIKIRKRIRSRGKSKIRIEALLARMREQAPSPRTITGQAHFNAPPPQPSAIRDEGAHGQGAEERQPAQVEDDQRRPVQRHPEQPSGQDLGLIETGLPPNGHPKKIGPTFDAELQFTFGLLSRGKD
jgi:hypothetical protein